jgi:hypothetical protein
MPGSAKKRAHVVLYMRTLASSMALATPVASKTLPGGKVRPIQVWYRFYQWQITAIKRWGTVNMAAQSPTFIRPPRD